MRAEPAGRAGRLGARLPAPRRRRSEERRRLVQPRRQNPVGSAVDGRMGNDRPRTARLEERLANGSAERRVVAMDLLVNIDVPDLARAVTFYTEAFGLVVTRRFGATGVELSGWPLRVYLLQHPEGSAGAGGNPRRYDRHWTPVHLDVVV